MSFWEEYRETVNATADALHGMVPFILAVAALLLSFHVVIYLLQRWRPEVADRVGDAVAFAYIAGIALLCVAASVALAISAYKDFTSADPSGWFLFDLLLAAGILYFGWFPASLTYALLREKFGPSKDGTADGWGNDR